jgi:hypothetical protein
MSSKPHSNATGLLRVVGGIILVLVLLLAGCAIFAPRNGLFGTPFANFQEVAEYTATLAGIAIVGVGLLFLQRWAAMIVSFAGIYVAFLYVKEGLAHSVPGQWNWVAFIFAALFIVPAVLTAYSWNNLVWWRHA